MKKLSGVFICLLLFTFISSARIIEVADAGITDKLRAVIAAKNAGAPAAGGCPSGTYQAYWNADHPSGFGYICYNSGAGNVNAAGNTQDSSADYISFDAVNEYLQWTDSNVLPNDESGTIFFTLYLTDSTPTGIENSALWESINDANNRMYCTIHGTQEKVYCTFKGNVTEDTILDAQALSFLTEYRVGYTWQTGVGGDDHCVSVETKGSATSWQCEDDDLVAWNAGSQPNDLTIGEAVSPNNTVNDTTQIYDVVLIGSFQGTDQNP